MVSTSGVRQGDMCVENPSMTKLVYPSVKTGNRFYGMVPTTVVVASGKNGGRKPVYWAMDP